MTPDPLYILANVGATLIVGIGTVSLFVAFRVIRDDRRRLADADQRIAAAARAASSPHTAFTDTLARAPDAFAEARARAAVLAAQIPPEIAAGEAPDPRAPRFLWWTTPEQAAAVEVAILPPWLARLFARRLCVRWDGVSVWSPPGLDQVAAPREDLGDACVITAAEFSAAFASPGVVTDLAGVPVKVAIDF